METTGILLQGVVVIGAILLGVRTGGIGLGLWGLVGLAVLVFGFGLPPGEPPTTSMFIILSVITAASTMQAVGGIDYLVEVAKKLLKKQARLHRADRPDRGLHLHAGRRDRLHLLPVDPGDLRGGLRQHGATRAPAWPWPAPRRSSPSPPARSAPRWRRWSGILDPVGFGITDILIVVLPASIVGLLVRLLPADARGQGARRTTRSTSGEWRRARSQPIDMSVLEARELPPEAKRSTMIFLAGIAVIMVLGMFEQLRPAFPDETGALVPLSTGDR